MGVIGGLFGELRLRLGGAKRASSIGEVRDFLEQRKVDEAAGAIERLPTDAALEAALCLRGEVAFRRREDKQAEAFFRDALARAPDLPDAHYGLSLVLLARDELDSATRHAQFAVNLGSAARFSAQLGLCELILGNYDRASASLSRATQLDPHDVASWNNLGIARRGLGLFPAARLAFERALSIDPAHRDATDNLERLEADAVTVRASYRESGRQAPAIRPDIAAIRAMEHSGVASALDACERLCADQPEREDAAIELARLYRERGDAMSGIDSLRAFVARHGMPAKAKAALGRMLLDTRDYTAALPVLEDAHRSLPDDIDVLVALSEVRTEEGRYNDAGALVERACELDPCLDMKGRLAASLCARCHYERCLSVIDEMLAEDPSVMPDVMGIRVDALVALGRHEEVMPALDRFVDERPNDPRRRFLRASVNLMREDYATGWDDYAYRNLQSARHLRMLPYPLWRGEPLEGKTILVAIEQGVGDQVMFASCIPDLQRLGPTRIVLEVSDRIAKTIARSFPQCEVVASRQDNDLSWVRDVGSIDYFVMLADLPARFRRSRSAFPAHGGYLVADPDRRRHWATEISGARKRPRIGVSWKGGTEKTRTTLRSLDPATLGTLATRIDADWVCLQYGDPQEGLDRARTAGLQLAYWSASIADLDEFAAIVASLDLVVSVCNTTVHYAGALGVPVWVMAPRVPEWRYGVSFESMPWYPGSRMFRQVRDGDWADVVGRVAWALTDWRP